MANRYSNLPYLVLTCLDGDSCTVFFEPWGSEHELGRDDVFTVYTSELSAGGVEVSYTARGISLMFSTDAPLTSLFEDRGEGGPFGVVQLVGVEEQSQSLDDVLAGVGGVAAVRGGEGNAELGRADDVPDPSAGGGQFPVDDRDRPAVAGDHVGGPDVRVGDDRAAARIRDLGRPGGVRARGPSLERVVDPAQQFAERRQEIITGDPRRERRQGHVAVDPAQYLATLLVLAAWADRYRRHSWEHLVQMGQQGVRGRGGRMPGPANRVADSHHLALVRVSAGQDDLIVDGVHFLAIRW